MITKYKGPTIMESFKRHRLTVISRQLKSNKLSLIPSLNNSLRNFFRYIIHRIVVLKMKMDLMFKLG